MVDPSEDNMLKICHDAKLVSTDVRLLDLTAEPDPNGKLYRCAERVYELWQQSANEKGAQVIFLILVFRMGINLLMYISLLKMNS